MLEYAELNGSSMNSRLDYGGGSGISVAGVSTPAPLVGSNTPTQRFDISVLSGLRPSDKYLGKNRVSDIQEAYDTYLTGAPVGRGGQYAVDAARRYGTTITEAARGYLATVGLPTLADIIAPPPTPPAPPDIPGPKEEDFFGLPVGPFEPVNPVSQSPNPVTSEKKSPVELLIDALPRLFGNATVSAPLQSQAYGYTPVSGDFSAGSGGTLSGSSAPSGSGIGMWLLLGAAAIAAYFIYKRYASS